MPNRRSSDTDLEILPLEDDDPPGPTAAVPLDLPRAQHRVPSRWLAVVAVVLVVGIAAATAVALHFRSQLEDARRANANLRRQAEALVSRPGPVGSTTTGRPFVADAAALSGEGSLALTGFYGAPGPDGIPRFFGVHVVGGPEGTVRELPLAAGGPADRPAWSPSGAWLAFVVNRSQAWVARADGTDAKLIDVTTNIGADAVSWSPAEDVLAVATDAGIRVLRPDGAAIGTVPGSAGVVSVSWAPDGRTLAYTRPTPAGDEILVASASGAEPRVVVKATLDEPGLTLAGWWPDGRGLLFWRHQHVVARSDGDLTSLRLDGGKPTKLVTMLRHRSWISWSPDRRHFVAVEGADSRAYHDKQLSLCDTHAAKCRPIMRRSGTVALDPAWSPDGSRIAYVEAGDAEFIPYDDWVQTRVLWTVRADGSSPHPLSGRVLAPGMPQWSRDGKSLLVVGMDAISFVDRDGRVRTVAGALYGRSFPPTYDDGYVDWAQTIAWRPA